MPDRTTDRPGERRGRAQLTAEGAEQLAARVDDIRGRRLPEMRPLLVETERDERVVAEFERLTEEAVRLDALLGQADVISLPPDSLDRGIVLGVRVLVTLEDGSEEWVRPVHPDEAFLDDERISASSPLAAALIGASVGDTVTVRAPSGAWPCRILDADLAGVIADD